MSTVVLYNPDGETIYISMARDMNLKVGLMLGSCLLIAGCGLQPMKPSPEGHVEASAANTGRRNPRAGADHAHTAQAQARCAARDL